MYGKIIGWIIIGILLVLPTLIGVGIYIFLAPATFWQTLAALIFAMLISGIVGFFTWLLALVNI